MKYKGCVVLGVDKAHIEQYLALVPSNHHERKIERDGDNYHLTVVSANEVNKNGDMDFDDSQDDFRILGLGFNKGCYFLVCIYPYGDRYRKKHGLGPKDFHITLGFESKDVHEIPKNIRTIIHMSDSIVHDMLAIPSYPTSKYIEFLKQLRERMPENPALIYRLATVYGNMRTETYCLEAIKLANILSQYDIVKAYYLILRIRHYFNTITDKMVKSMIKGLVAENEITQSEELVKLLEILNSFLIRENEQLILDTSKLKLICLPRNFSFIDNDKLVSGSGGISKDNLLSLKYLGISNIVTLTEDPLTIDDNDITFYHYPIIDRREPTIETVNSILNIINDNIQKKVKINIHCVGGIGRTNTILACYLMSRDLSLSPSSAISYLKQDRIVKLEPVQVNFLKEYYAFLHNPDRKFNNKLPKAIMLVGPPCSGKTTFSLSVIKTYHNVIHINQDDLGNKCCYDLVSANTSNNKTLIIDSCNLTVMKRKEWFSALNLANSRVECVFFNYPIQKCKDRFLTRTCHPTLQFDGKNHARGFRVIEQNHNSLETPSKSEGFSQIFQINSNHDLGDLYEHYGVNYVNPDKMLKFPRTPHLANLNAATDDDIICSDKIAKEVLSNVIMIEEKIDGACTGIYVDSEDKLMVHNRSHFVNPKSDDQYNKLDKWLRDHTEDLYHILGNKKLVLYGEWVATRHSIHYTGLPDLFLVFDIYNRETNQFYSRTKIIELLQPTNLQLVPLMAIGNFTFDDLLKMIKTKSMFYDGEIEGVYIRTFTDEIVTGRYKLVRCDFISGDEHWRRKPKVPNGITF